MKNDIFYRSLLDNITDGIYFVDVNRKITFWNKGAEEITGYPADEVTGHSCLENILVHVDENGRNLCMGHCPIVDTITKGEPHVTDVFLHHKQGHRVPVHVQASPLVDDTGQIIGAVEVFSDITEHLAERKNIEELKRAALVDALTGLPNRRYLEMKLDAVFEEHRRFGMSFGVFFCDIDHFKVVNDTYGHAMGDDVLKMVASTLESNVRSSDLVGRWGGEEFVGVLTHAERDALVPIVEKLRLLVEKSFIDRDGLMLKVTATFGVTLCREGDTAESIIARADNLLYEGKQGGRNRVIEG